MVWPLQASTATVEKTSLMTSLDGGADQRVWLEKVRVHGWEGEGVQTLCAAKLTYEW